jgi:hypothetical protein
MSPYGVKEVFKKDCTIVSGTAGTCKYTILENDFGKRWIYFARIEIDNGTTSQESTQDFIWEVV